MCFAAQSIELGYSWLEINEALTIVDGVLMQNITIDEWGDILTTSERAAKQPGTITWNDHQERTLRGGNNPARLTIQAVKN